MLRFVTVSMISLEVIGSKGSEDSEGVCQVFCVKFFMNY